MSSVTSSRARPRLVHVATTDMSLSLLLGPQLVAFQKAGYEVIGMSAPGSHVADLAAAGIAHVALENTTRAMSPRRDIAAFFELRRAFRALSPDIVHTHNPKPGVYGRLAAKAAGVPAIVNTVHGLYALPEDAFAKRAVVYSLERLAATCSDAELVQNPEDMCVLEGLGISAKKLHLLGNGIDLKRFHPGTVSAERVVSLRASWGADSDTVVCGLVGRLVAEKGYREVFMAARELRKSQTNLKFVVIGPTDPDKSDAISAKEQGAARVDAGVVFLGFRDDVHELYEAMDLFILASWREGFPRSAMEAAAMGLPLVVTDIRGCRQVVDDGETGLLVGVRDPRGLARSIAELAGSAQKRKTMGMASRCKASAEFNQERQIERTLSVYHELGVPPQKTAGASG